MRSSAIASYSLTGSALGISYYSIKFFTKNLKVLSKDSRKILIFYHPSYANVHMDINEYIKDVTSRFSDIINVGYFEEIKEENIDSNLSKNDYINKFFVIPDVDNKITENDIRKGYIRITKDYRKFFPEQDSLLSVKIDNLVFNVQFIYKSQRSHLLKLGKNIIDSIDLKPGDKLNIKRESFNSYEIILYGPNKET